MNEIDSVIVIAFERWRKVRPHLSAEERQEEGKFITELVHNLHKLKMLLAMEYK